MKNHLLNHELTSLSVVACLALASILPSLHFMIHGYVPELWLRESGVYETLGAAACLVASLFGFRASTNGAGPGRLWLILFAAACLFIAGEEISWGQHFLEFEVPEHIAANNFQNEFNLHNSSLIQSSNNSISSIFFKLLMLYLILLPMFLAAFPTLKRWAQRMMLPVPSMRIAIIALLAKAADVINYQVIYGSAFSSDHLHLGEVVESIIEICLLILAMELFMASRKPLTATLPPAVEPGHR